MEELIIFIFLAIVFGILTIWFSVRQFAVRKKYTMFHLVTAAVFALGFVISLIGIFTVR